jgi:hypothetical protein|tara:strand:- start:181 stop:354 length:174 start_codon:yes stop_codon:yes gene_type:complete
VWRSWNNREEQALWLLFFPVSLPKFINSTGSINNFLLACVERVASRTNLDVKIIAEG